MNNTENVTPLKNHLFSRLRNIVTLPKGIYQHLHFKGPIEVSIDGSNTSFKMNHFGYQLENGVFWRGIPNGWEPPSTAIWIESCKISKVILDVGANTGLYALIAKALKPEAQVYAFEPVKRVFEKMEKNFEMNNFQIKSICLALSNRDGKAVIYDSDTEHTYSVTVDKNLNSSDVKVFQKEIDIARLDTIWKSQGTKIDLIKLDVESHEGEVLEGMGNILKDSKPDILIEIISEEVGRKVESILGPLGYKYFRLQSGLGPKLVEKFPVDEQGNSFACTEERAKLLKIPLVV